MSDETRALLHLVFLMLMLLILVGGSVSILLLWWMRGRDPHAGPMASYLAEPPDDLSPGVVGTLVDERADYHDVLATLLGLGRYGAVKIAHVPGPRGNRNDYEITMVDPALVRGELDRTVLDVVFGGTLEAGATVRLSAVRHRFQRAEKSIRAALYRELVTQGYFLRSPEETRRRWAWVARAGLIISIVGGGFLGISLDPFAFLAMAAGIIVSLILLRVSRSMPRKTLAGAEAAAKWNAFRVYLKDIRKYQKVEEATDLFERYLPYAVAFGLERDWVRTFAAAGAPVPGWFQPISTSIGERTGVDVGDLIWTAAQVAQASGHHRHSGGGSGGDVGLPNVGMPNVDLSDLPSMPDIDVQGLADVAGGGLQGASDALGGLFDLAGSIFDAIDIDFN